MLTQLRTTLTKTAILSLVLVFALSVAWAVQNHSTSKQIGNSGGKFDAVKTSRKDKVKVTIKKGALKAYLEEQGLNEVEITVETTEDFVPCGSGSHYHFIFTCGPNGTYFDTPLELEIKGKYFETGCHVWLFNEDGEALEGVREDGNDKIVFKIPHFSSYSYEQYDY